MAQTRPLSPWTLAAGTALALGASALYVQHKRRQVEAAHPPRGQFVVVEGVRLHYTEHGDPQAPALVMLHGIGTMGLELELSGLVERAARQYRVLVFDRPGYGHSDTAGSRAERPERQAQLLLQALHQLNVERPLVLAHSWATLVAMSMALASPSALKGLILLGGYYTPAPRLDVLINGLPALPLVGRLMARTVSPLLSRAIWSATMWRMFSPASGALRRDFLARYPKWMTLRPAALETAASEAAMLVPEAIRMRRHHGELALPIVIVAGEQDRLIAPAWHSGRLMDRLPQARLHLVPGSGHMVHHSDPEAVLAAIREVSSLVTSDTPLDIGTAERVAPEDEPLLNAR